MSQLSIIFNLLLRIKPVQTTTILRFGDGWGFPIVMSRKIPIVFLISLGWLSSGQTSSHSCNKNYVTPNFNNIWRNFTNPSISRWNRIISDILIWSPNITCVWYRPWTEVSQHWPWSNSIWHPRNIFILHLWMIWYIRLLSVEGDSGIKGSTFHHTRSKSWPIG